jgi:AraC-like DNA-binding protein
MTRGSFTMHRCILPRCQAIEACSADTFPRHWHDTYGVGLILRGAQKSWSGRGNVEAGRGNVITCNPGEVHDGMPIGGARIWRMLHFPPALIETIVADIREGRSAPFEFAHPVIDRRDFASTVAGVYRAMTSQDANSESAHERLIELIASLLNDKPRAFATATSALNRAKTRIDDDPTLSMTLADLATDAGLSRFQALRGFAKLTGMTPHAYLVQRRLDVARSMIAHGAQLAEAAVASGFSDQSHLTRAFARRYGVTPGAFATAIR